VFYKDKYFVPCIYFPFRKDSLLYPVLLTGEEVTENYFPYYTHMPRRERIPWLSGHYRFECGCVACTNNFPTRWKSH
jgi:hypothetical protein